MRELVRASNLGADFYCQDFRPVHLRRDPGTNKGIEEHIIQVLERDVATVPVEARDIES